MVRRIVALTWGVFVALAVAGSADVGPGSVIDKDRLDEEARELLTPSMEWMVEHGLEIPVVETKHVPWPSRYREATEKYSPQVKLSADGRSIENHVAGLPFPNVEPDDPQAGIKVMWNQELKPVYTDDVQTQFIFELTDGNGNIDRTQIWDRWRRLFWSGRLYHDPKPVISHDPQIRFTEMFGPALAPEDIRNTTALSIRYSDADIPDDTYLYLPQLRRVRRVPVNNRTDAIFGTDMDLDSTWGFNSKVENFDFQVLARKKILAPVHSGKYGTEELYQVEPGNGVRSWMPDGDWEKRTVWVIQGKPRISPYAFKKGIFYVDAEFWQMNFTEWFDKKGELWKIWWNMFWFTDNPRPGKVFTEPGTDERIPRAVTSAGMEADLKAMHTTKWRAPSQFGLRQDTGWQFDAGPEADNAPEQHTVSYMVEIGR